MKLAVIKLCCFLGHVSIQYVFIPVCVTPIQICNHGNCLVLAQIRIPTLVLSFARTPSPMSAVLVSIPRLVDSPDPHADPHRNHADSCRHVPAAADTMPTHKTPC